MRPDQFIPLETMLLDPVQELWRQLGSTTLLAYVAHRAAHQQYTHSEGRKGQDAIRAKHDQIYFDTEERLGRRVGLSESTVKRANVRLCRVGLLHLVERGRKGRPNRYQLPRLTLPLLVEVARRAKAPAGQPDPQWRSRRPLVQVSLTPSAGQRDLRTRSEIYKRNGEVKSRKGVPLTEEQSFKPNPTDGASAEDNFSRQEDEAARADEARQLIRAAVGELAMAKTLPR